MDEWGLGWWAWFMERGRKRDRRRERRREGKTRENESFFVFLVF